MIRIKVPATSANLAVGFDSLGVALNLYNTFVFEPSSKNNLIGFEQEHRSNENLVLKAYQAFASNYGDVQPVQITLEQSEIPVSRGLGSSASCIVAGVLAANSIHNLQKSNEECIRFAAELEGHPDNVYAAFYGSLTAVMKDEQRYYHQTFPVSSSLKWNVLIPNTTGNTQDLRNALPDMVPMSTAVFHLSRMIHLPTAFLAGDIKLLQRLLQDEMHEQYRYPSIPQYNDILTLKDTINGTITISGSGPSILIISTSNINQHVQHLDAFELHSCSLAMGTTLEVLS
jgi:homoserine kinase